MKLLIDWYRPPLRVRTGGDRWLWISAGHRAQWQLSIHRQWFRWWWADSPRCWCVQFAWFMVMVCR